MLGQVFIYFSHAWKKYWGCGYWGVGSCQIWTLNNLFQKFCVRLILSFKEENAFHSSAYAIRLKIRLHFYFTCIVNKGIFCGPLLWKSLLLRKNRFLSQIIKVLFYKLGCISYVWKLSLKVFIFKNEILNIWRKTK